MKDRYSINEDSREELDEIEIIDIDAVKKEPHKKKLNKKKNRKKIMAITLFVCFLMALGFSFSWYRYTKDNHADTKDVEIMTPYFLYLLNPDDTTSLQFSVGNIHPGETKQIVICVSNKRPEGVTDSIDIARESEFAYDIEFLYTENLKVDYKIFELDKTRYENENDIPSGGILVEEVAGFYWTKKKYEDDTDPNNIVNVERQLTVDKDVTDERLLSVFGADAAASGYSGIHNKGKYLLYQHDGNGNELALKYDNEYEYDYYLVEISWQDGVNFSEFTKETDLLYIVVNAKQPKPVRNN